VRRLRPVFTGEEREALGLLVGLVWSGDKGGSSGVRVAWGGGQAGEAVEDCGAGKQGWKWSG
jgi:hypothetical protein